MNLEHGGCSSHPAVRKPAAFHLARGSLPALGCLFGLPALRPVYL